MSYKIQKGLFFCEKSKFVMLNTKSSNFDSIFFLICLITTKPSPPWVCYGRCCRSGTVCRGTVSRSCSRRSEADSPHSCERSAGDGTWTPLTECPAALWDKHHNQYMPFDFRTNYGFMVSVYPVENISQPDFVSVYY